MQDVKTDRHKYIGGSDIPIIMGISPFKKRFDLLLEKASLKENDFEGNEYTEYGNVLEPKIRDYINSIGLVTKLFKEDKKVIGDIRCHVDGFNGDMILEIKTTSQIHYTLDEYKVYLVQLLFYMQNYGVQRGCLAVYDRPSDFNEEFDEDRLKIYFLDIDNYKELLEEINTAVDQFRVDLIKVKNNPFITEEELLPVSLVELSNQVVEIEDKLAELKEFEKQAKELKAQLKKAMEDNNIKSWETPNGTKITLIPDAEDKEVMKFNEEKFKEENEETYNKYLESKIQKGKSGYVKVTL